MGWKIVSKPMFHVERLEWIVEVRDEAGALLESRVFKDEGEAKTFYKDFIIAQAKAQPDVDVVLTPEQEQKIKDLWNSRPKDNPPSLMELTQAAFGKPDLDGRTKEGRAVKKMLAEAKLKAPVAGDYKPKGLLILTEEQKEYVENNCGTLKAVEMARVLFGNATLTNLSAETRTILDYLKTVAKPVADDPADITPEAEYRPPKSFDKVLLRINKYRNEQLDKDKLTGKQKKDIAALQGHMNNNRFLRQINTYEKMQDRELFESTFVRCCYDKHDLTEEEVDQYILYATEVVTGMSISIRVEQLRKIMDEAVQKDEDERKIAMQWVEAIDKTQTEYDKCVSRQNKLLDVLKVKRSEKEGKSKEGAANIINLIQTWKDEETRKRMLKYAEYRKNKTLKKGIDDLMSMDEIRSRILGLSIDEAMNG